MLQLKLTAAFRMAEGEGFETQVPIDNAQVIDFTICLNRQIRQNRQFPVHIPYTDPPSDVCPLHVELMEYGKDFRYFHALRALPREALMPTVPLLVHRR